MFRTQNILHLIAALAAGLFIALPVSAQSPQSETTVQFNATVIEVDGEVLVNQGERYVPAQKGIRVKNGDRIMVMKDGGAKIKYDNSCVEDAKTFSIYEVDDLAACPLVHQTEQTHLAKAGGPLTNPGVIGTLTVIGIVLLDDDDDKRRSVSP